MCLLTHNINHFMYTYVSTNSFMCGAIVFCSGHGDVAAPANAAEAGVGQRGLGGLLRLDSRGLSHREGVARLAAAAGGAHAAELVDSHSPAAPHAILGPGGEILYYIVLYYII